MAIIDTQYMLLTVFRDITFEWNANLEVALLDVKSKLSSLAQINQILPQKITTYIEMYYIQFNRYS